MADSPDDIAVIQAMGRLLKRIATLESAIRSVEWSGGHCPECGAVRWSDEPEDKTHNPGCALHAALGA